MRPSQGPGSVPHRVQAGVCDPGSSAAVVSTSNLVVRVSCAHHANGDVSWTILGKAVFMRRGQAAPLTGFRQASLNGSTQASAIQDRPLLVNAKSDKISAMTFPSLHIPEHLYFITASIIGWKPLFYKTVYAGIVMDSLKWLRENKRILLFAYVLMPSHLHMLIRPLDCDIGQLLQVFGSFTAHKILKQLRSENRTEWIHYFKQHRRDQNIGHSIWQDIQAVNVFTQPFLENKLEYIHNNPVAKEFKMVENRSDYPFSSANFNDNGAGIMIPVDDIREYL
jgi:putative transposase